MERIKHVFKVCYELLEKYSGGIKESDWSDIAKYHDERLDPSDPFAIDMHTACYKELSRLYEASK